MKKIINVVNLGKLAYSPSLKLQKAVANFHRENEETIGTLLLVEHFPVYTTGIRTKEYSLKDEIKLRKTGAEFYRTNRGGLITFHGPGQLVTYPILNLKHLNLGLRNYVCNIEKWIITVCEKYNLKAETSPHTGVWIGDNKICAIGVHASRYITTHGLALNVCTDLKWFEHIVPCGIEGKGVTSFSKELQRHVSISEIIPIFLTMFEEIFKCQPVEASNSLCNEIIKNSNIQLKNCKITN